MVSAFLVKGEQISTFSPFRIAYQIRYPLIPNQMYHLLDGVINILDNSREFGPSHASSLSYFTYRRLHGIRYTKDSLLVATFIEVEKEIAKIELYMENAMPITLNDWVPAFITLYYQDSRTPIKLALGDLDYGFYAGVKGDQLLSLGLPGDIAIPLNIKDPKRIKEDCIKIMCTCSPEYMTQDAILGLILLILQS